MKKVKSLILCARSRLPTPTHPALQNLQGLVSIEFELRLRALVSGPVLGFIYIDLNLVGRQHYFSGSGGMQRSRLTSYV